jgi:hypothetical protein
MKDSDDHSIFAWRYPRSLRVNPLELRGLLAISPRDFFYSSDFVTFRNWSQSRPFSITNNGLSIRLDMVASGNDGIYSMAALNCWASADSTKRVAIKLKRIQGDQYARVAHNELFYPLPYGYPPDPPTIFIRKDPVEVGLNDILDGGMLFRLRGRKNMRTNLSVAFVSPLLRWDKSDTAFFTTKPNGRVGVLLLRCAKDQVLVIVGSYKSSGPFCLFNRPCDTSFLRPAFLEQNEDLKSQGWNTSIETIEHRITSIIKQRDLEDTATIYDVYLSMVEKNSKESSLSRGISRLISDESSFEPLWVRMS